MKFNFLMTGILTLVAITTGARPQSGGMDGGGGNAVVCRDLDKKITSAELLDFYEVRNLYGLDIISAEPGQTYEEIAEKMAKKVDIGGGGASQTAVSTSHDASGNLLSVNIYLHPLREYFITELSLHTIMNSMRLLQSGVGLKPIDDSFHIIVPIPQGCAIEQVAVFNDSTRRLFIVRDIWEKFDETNKAALLIHEALYRETRRNGEKTSESTRLAVGQVFAGVQLTDIRENITSPVLACNTKEEDPLYQFVIYKKIDDPQKAILQFLRVSGHVPFTKTYYEVPTLYTPLNQNPIEPGVGFGSFGNLISAFNEGLHLGWQAESNHKGQMRYFVGLENTLVLGGRRFSEVNCHEVRFKINEDGVESGN